MEKPILLDKPMKMSDMIKGEGFTFTANFKDDILNAEDSDQSDDETVDVATESSPLDEVNLIDEDLYEFNQVPFDDIKLLMIPVDIDGKVMKRIILAGKGDFVPKESKVTYHYKAYQEFEACAFDSTHDRRKAEVSNLNNVLYGLNIAISSMRTREKSQFIVAPEWAYGELGIPPSIPPQATILFEIEVLGFTPLGENDVDETDKDLRESKDYATNFARALKLCTESKHLIKEKKERPAIRNYNEAIRILSKVALQNDEQESDYVTLLVRLYTNLAIAHNRLEHWANCCLQCKEVYKLSTTFYRPVNGKVYYQHAKALDGLGDYKRAEEQLRKVAKTDSYDRPNKDVMNLYKKIQEGKEQAAVREKNLAQAMFSGATKK